MSTWQTIQSTLRKIQRDKRIEVRIGSELYHQVISASQDLARLLSLQEPLPVFQHLGLITPAKIPESARSQVLQAVQVRLSLRELPEIMDGTPLFKENFSKYIDFAINRFRKNQVYFVFAPYATNEQEARRDGESARKLLVAKRSLTAAQPDLHDKTWFVGFVGPKHQGYVLLDPPAKVVIPYYRTASDLLGSYEFKFIKFSDNTTYFLALEPLTSKIRTGHTHQIVKVTHWKGKRKPDKAKLAFLDWSAPEYSLIKYDELPPEIMASFIRWLDDHPQRTNNPIANKRFFPDLIGYDYAKHQQYPFQLVLEALVQRVLKDGDWLGLEWDEEETDAETGKVEEVAYSFAIYPSVTPGMFDLVLFDFRKDYLDWQGKQTVSPDQLGQRLLRAWKDMGARVAFSEPSQDERTILGSHNIWTSKPPPAPLLDQRGKPVTNFYGYHNGIWIQSNEVVLGALLQYDWEISIGYSRKKDNEICDVTNATEYSPGLISALEDIVQYYPAMLDYEIHFDGPNTTIRAVLSRPRNQDWSEIEFFHGTSTVAWERIQREGLRPRSLTGSQAIHGAQYYSHAEAGDVNAVYLTTQYGTASFASADAIGKLGGKRIILKIKGIDGAKTIADVDARTTDPRRSLWSLGSIGYLGSIPHHMIEVFEVKP